MGKPRHIYWFCGIAGLMLGFDGFCWHRFAAQVAAKNYRTTPGQVMRLQHLHPPPDAAGEVRPQISFSYTYRVNGSGYVGDSYSYLEKSPAAEIPLPHGKQIPVFYNPAAPADAVLSREVTADDFEKMLQLTLLNLMGFSFLGLWTRGRARKIFSVPQLWQS